MKTNLLLTLLVLFFISSGFVGGTGTTGTGGDKYHQARTANGNFDFFRTHRQGRSGATATWGFSSGSAVSGFVLEKTYEDPSDPYANWETIALLPYSATKSYKHTDSNVLPGYISYKVTAMMTNGASVTSVISTLHIVSH